MLLRLTPRNRCIPYSLDIVYQRHVLCYAYGISCDYSLTPNKLLKANLYILQLLFHFGFLQFQRSIPELVISSLTVGAQGTCPLSRPPLATFLTHRTAVVLNMRLMFTRKRLSPESQPSSSKTGICSKNLDQVFGYLQLGILRKLPYLYFVIQPVFKSLYNTPENSRELKKKLLTKKIYFRQ